MRRDIDSSAERRGGRGGNECLRDANVEGNGGDDAR